MLCSCFMPHEAINMPMLSYQFNIRVCRCAQHLMLKYGAVLYERLSRALQRTAVGADTDVLFKVRDLGLTKPGCSSQRLFKVQLQPCLACADHDPCFEPESQGFIELI